jgi:uncharacterized membrane protein (DUF373 family)
VQFRRPPRETRPALGELIKKQPKDAELYSLRALEDEQLLDFVAAANAFSRALSNHNLAHGVVDAIDRELVIDVLSVFVLIELFRTFTDYLEFHRVRLRVLAEVGIAFILREIFIGLYDHSIHSPEILALSLLLAVLVAARIAAVLFHPGDAAPRSASR